MELTIETKEESRRGDVINAYNEAMGETNLSDFIKSLEANIGNSKIGKGSNHVWVCDAKTDERIAIITNLIQ